MFNKFVKMVFDKTIETIDKLIAIDEDVKKLDADYRADLITAKTMNKKKDDLRNEIPAIQFEYNEEITNIRNLFETALKKYEMIDGSKVHEDAKIFDYDITLTAEQLQELVNKHHDNAFMLQLIEKYCMDHRNIFIVMPLTGKARRDKFTQFINDANYCVFSPYSLKKSFFEAGQYTPDLDSDFPVETE